jgi:uncharacterized protein (TIGR03000 family)
MYSIVLMMALNTSADVPAFGHGCRGCNGCNGCHGAVACNGGGCHGCRGGHGCNGCNGGCHGCRGGHGLFGGLFKGHGCRGCNGGCHGCNGCNGGCHGAGCHGCTGGAVKPAEPVKEMPKEKKEGVSAPATIVINVPADAKITIDDNPTRSTETVRRFVTPALETGKDFYYTVKAELVVDGQSQTETKRVMVRAGQESQVTIEFAAASVASK